MTINEIFKEVEYGKEYCAFETIKESLEKAYDKENDIFYASKRIKDIVKKVALNEDCEKIVNKIINKCEVIEDRIYNEDKMSPQYKKLNSISIYEECEKLNTKASKRAEYATMKGEELGKVIATAKYFVENFLDSETVLKESTNVQFNRFVKDELYNISQVL